MILFLSIATLQHSTEHSFAPRLALCRKKETIKLFNCLQRFHMQHEFAKSPYYKKLPSPPPPPPKTAKWNVSKWWNQKEIYRFRVVGKYFDLRKVSANSDNECENGTNIESWGARERRSINFNVSSMICEHFSMDFFSGLVTLPTLDFIESTFDACFRSARFGNVPFFFRYAENWWKSEKHCRWYLHRTTTTTTTIVQTTNVLTLVCTMMQRPVS